MPAIREPRLYPFAQEIQRELAEVRQFLRSERITLVDANKMFSDISTKIQAELTKKVGSRHLYKSDSIEYRLLLAFNNYAIALSKCPERYADEKYIESHQNGIKKIIEELKAVRAPEKISSDEELRRKEVCDDEVDTSLRIYRQFLSGMKTIAEQRAKEESDRIRVAEIEQTKRVEEEAQRTRSAEMEQARRAENEAQLTRVVELEKAQPVQAEVQQIAVAPSVRAEILFAMQRAIDALSVRGVMRFSKSSKEERLSQLKSRYATANMSDTEADCALRQFIVEIATPRPSFFFLTTAAYGDTTSANVFFRVFQSATAKQKILSSIAWPQGDELKSVNTGGGVEK